MSVTHQLNPVDLTNYVYALSADLTSSINTLTNSINTVSADLTSSVGTVSANLTSDVNTLTTDINTLTTEVNTLTTSVNTLTTDVSVLSTDLTTDVNTLTTSKFNIPTNSGTIGDILSLASGNTSVWISNSSSAPNYGMYYGLTAGIGNGGATDYSATIAVKTLSTPGSGRVPFPRNNGSVNNIVLANSSQDPNTSTGYDSLLLPNAATYEVSFNIHTTEPGQFNIELTTSGTAVDLPETVTSNMDATAGGHEYTCLAYITTSVANCTIAVVNSIGNSTALTITPANGAQTHASAQRFSAKQL